jgi:hypothetical protein
MEFGRVQIASLVGIKNTALNAKLCKSIETMGGNAKPVIVVREKFNEETGDYDYRVVGNHDVAVACQGYRSVNRRFEMVNAFIVDSELQYEVMKQFN